MTEGKLLVLEVSDFGAKDKMKARDWRDLRVALERWKSCDATVRADLLKRLSPAALAAYQEADVVMLLGGVIKGLLDEEEERAAVDPGPVAGGDEDAVEGLDIVTPLIKGKYTPKEAILRAPVVVSRRGAVLKNRHGEIDPDNDLCCTLLNVQVVGTLVTMDFPRHENCDMGAAVILASCLCPWVTKIHTYSGGKPDTSYFLENGEWSSRMM